MAVLVVHADGHRPGHQSHARFLSLSLDAEASRGQRATRLTDRLVAVKVHVTRHAVRLSLSRLQLASDVVERVALGAGAVLPTLELADRCALGPPLDDVVGVEAEAAR